MGHAQDYMARNRQRIVTLAQAPKRRRPARRSTP